MPSVFGNVIAVRSLCPELRKTMHSSLSLTPDDDLEEFIRQVAHLQGHGVSPRQNATSADQNWSFGQALFFSSTLITTIGYGHITPLTQAGKLFCMLYAIVGIPLTLVLLSAAVERLLVPAGWLLAVLQSRFGHLYRPLNIRLCHLALIGKRAAPWALAALLWACRRRGMAAETAVNVVGLGVTWNV